MCKPRSAKNHSSTCQLHIKIIICGWWLSAGTVVQRVRPCSTSLSVYARVQPRSACTPAFNLAHRSIDPKLYHSNDSEFEMNGTWVTMNNVLSKPLINLPALRWQVAEEACVTVGAGHLSPRTQSTHLLPHLTDLLLLSFDLKVQASEHWHVTRFEHFPLEVQFLNLLHEGLMQKRNRFLRCRPVSESDCTAFLLWIYAGDAVPSLPSEEILLWCWRRMQPMYNKLCSPISSFLSN